jgi:hypothetical protein
MDMHFYLKEAEQEASRKCIMFGTYYYFIRIHDSKTCHKLANPLSNQIKLIQPFKFLSF